MRETIPSRSIIMDLSPMRKDWALFFDIDGTLSELVPKPEDAIIPDEVLNKINDIYHYLDGAVAMVSGRNLAMVDKLTAPYIFPGGGQHGLEMRDASGQVESFNKNSDVISMLIPLINQFQQRYPMLTVENKGLSIAVHYRVQPSLRSLTIQYLNKLIYPYKDKLVLQEGKMVAEIKLSDADKGKAIEYLMRSSPFKGRIPVFFGDDTTDEYGFAEVNKRGGISVKIGEEATCALYHCNNVTDVWWWISNALN